MQHYRESMNNSRVTLFSNTSDCNYCYVDLSKAELPILLISTFFFNSVALIILFKIRKKSDEVNHFLVTTIAGNDFGSTVIFMIMWIGGWIKCGCMLTSVTCAILGWFGTAAVVWSAWIVIVTSVIRYLATVKPLYYRAHITPTKVHIATYATLVFTLLQLAFPFFGAAAPYKYYEDNFICAYDFSPGSFSKSHRVILGFLSVEGLLASASTMYLNFSIVYEVSIIIILSKFIYLFIKFALYFSEEAGNLPKGFLFNVGTIQQAIIKISNYAFEIKETKSLLS